MSSQGSNEERLVIREPPQPTKRSRARAFVIYELGHGEVREFELPQIGRDDALLRVECAGVCGTDLKIFHGRYGGQLNVRSNPLPLIPGHEICGTIEELGETAARRWGVSIGDRVAVDSFLACGSCDACLSGQVRFCREMADYGVTISANKAPHLWGGFAEFVYLAPGAQVYRLPPGLSPELGVLIPAVVSNAVRWTDNEGGVSLGSTVLICGPGPIGLACVVVAYALGASRIFISGLPSDERRLDLAQQLGAHETLFADGDLRARVLELTEGVGVDVVLDVSGSVDSLAAAPGLVRRQGTIVAAGLSGSKAAHLPMDDVTLQEITIKGVFSHDRSSILRALNLVERSPESFDGFITHRYSLEETPAAIEIVGAADPTLVKSAVQPLH